MLVYASFRNQNEGGAGGYLRVPYGDGVTDYTSTERSTMRSTRDALDAAIRAVGAQYLDGSQGFFLIPTTRSGGQQTIEVWQGGAPFAFPNRPASPPASTFITSLGISTTPFDNCRNAGNVVHARLRTAMDGLIVQSVAGRSQMSAFEYQNMIASMRADPTETFFTWQTGHIGYLTPFGPVNLGPGPNQAQFGVTWYSSPAVLPGGTSQVRFRIFSSFDGSFPQDDVPTFAPTATLTVNHPSGGFAQGLAGIVVPLPEPVANGIPSGFQISWLVVADHMVNGVVQASYLPDVQALGYPTYTYP